MDFAIKVQCLDSRCINVTIPSFITEEKAEKAYRITPLSHNLRPVSLPVSIDTPPKEFQHFLCKVLWPRVLITAELKTFTGMLYCQDANSEFIWKFTGTTNVFQLTAISLGKCARELAVYIYIIIFDTFSSHWGFWSLRDPQPKELCNFIGSGRSHDTLALHCGSPKEQIN